ncbi:MAG: SDR family NAD(P)-dependent oxidoreductase, partial [Ruminococcaceae bacterium]|nr:SDR family NAD(P)-dependent oxidoreductase [Oscillospiraceae bacterium]
MRVLKWLQLYTSTLKNKTVAITGSTGGIGRQLCNCLAKLGADLLLVDRNYERSQNFANHLSKTYDITVKCITCDLENFSTVKAITEKLKNEKIDIFIHNAGAYSIPRKICDTGFDNVFQINFLSPYYIIKQLLPQLKTVNGRVVVVGSIA